MTGAGSASDALSQQFEQVLRQAAWHGKWEPAWLSPASPTGSAGVSQQYSARPHVGPPPPPQPPPQQQQHVAAALQPHLHMAQYASGDLEALFAQLEPEACLIGLQVRHLLGLSLQELSASQLDALRQLHARKMEAVVEAALQAAREQGRLLAEEETRRSSTFESWATYYFG
jgi:hypothetical protein